MRPLAPDDLLPLDEFAAQRAEHFAAHARYLDRYRRVRVGPRVTLQFENRQTLWFRVQELLRVARLTDPARVREELALSNELLPRHDLLQAALFISVADESRLTEELAFWRDLGPDAVRLRIGAATYPARVVTDRPEDRCIGAAQWVVFPLDADAPRLLAAFHLPAVVEVDGPSYRHESPLLSDETRQSLLDDLELSDRAERRAA